MTSKLSTKGQLIIPKSIRENLGWAPGTTVEIEKHKNGVLIRAAGDLPRTSLDDVVGCTGYQGPKKSLDEMEAGIARRARADK